MSSLCQVFSPRKRILFCNFFVFSNFIQTSSLPVRSINEDSTFASVVDSLHKGLDWKNLTEKFKSFKFSKPVVEKILLQLKEPVDSKKALNFFHWSAKEMHLQHGISIYCITVHILVKARLIKDAKALLESVITTKDSSDQNDQAVLVLHSLIGSYEVVDSVPFVFDIFIQTCAKLRIMDGALDACNLLFDHGFSLNLTTFNTLLHVMQRSNATCLVWSVYKHMIYTKVYPNEVTVRIMVSALCKEGKLERFVDIVARMNGKRCSIPGTIVNTCLLYEMIVQGKIEDALVLLKWLLQKNLILDTVSYCLVIFAKAKMGKLSSAKETYDELLKRGFEQNAFVCSIFIGKYCDSGKISEAIGLLGEMEALSLRPLDETYNCLIEACATNGRLEDCLKLCTKMIELRLLPNCSTIDKMFGKLCECGNSKRADQMLTILLDKGFTPNDNTYSLLIDGYGRNGDLEGVMRILFEMRYRSISPNMLGFSSLIIILCKNGKVYEAEKYLKMMKAKSYLPSPSVYDSLIAAHIQKGDITRADQLKHERGCEKGNDQVGIMEG